METMLKSSCSWTSSVLTKHDSFSVSAHLLDRTLDLCFELFSKRLSDQTSWTNVSISVLWGSFWLMMTSPLWYRDIFWDVTVPWNSRPVAALHTDCGSVHHTASLPKLWTVPLTSVSIQSHPAWCDSSVLLLVLWELFIFAAHPDCIQLLLVFTCVYLFDVELFR